MDLKWSILVFKLSIYVVIRWSKFWNQLIICNLWCQGYNWSCGLTPFCTSQLLNFCNFRIQLWTCPRSSPKREEIVAGWGRSESISASLSSHFLFFWSKTLQKQTDRERKMVTIVTLSLYSLVRGGGPRLNRTLRLPGAKIEKPSRREKLSRSENILTNWI